MSEVRFNQAPVVEVSFGVRYPPLQQLQSAHFGLFWASIITEFDATSDQPPIVESPQKAVSEEVIFARRVWLVHRQKNLLIQLQRDRFHLNWRKLGEGVDYPGFETLVPQFERYVNSWFGFLEKHAIGFPEAMNGMLTYVNQVPVDSLASGGRVFTGLNESMSMLPVFEKLEGLSWAATFTDPCGRISADVKTFRNKSEASKRMLQLELKADSASDLKDSRALFEWIRVAHKSLVESFTSLTTGHAQKELWDRGDR
jgi:uncharacterized protein (TIGR04255 family)